MYLQEHLHISLWIHTLQEDTGQVGKAIHIYDSGGWG